MIIDSHVHIGKTEKSERFFTFKTYLELINKCNVDKAIIMPNVSNVISSIKLNDNFLTDYNNLLESEKNKLYPFLLIDPNDPLILDQIFNNLNLIKGIKYHPSITTTTCTDENIYNMLNKLPDNFIVLVHCGRNWRSHISYLIKAAEDFKNLIFIAAHMGGNATDLIEEALNLLNKSFLKNIYIDISTCKLPWLIERAIWKIGDDKILFGSDEPYGDTLVTKYCLSLATIKKESYEKITYKNVLRILGESFG